MKEKKMMTSLHHSCTFLVFTFLISIIFCYTFSTDGIVLSSTESFTFSSNRTIVSPGDVFELGIFKPDRDGDRWYLGIWFKKISNRTYVWVANRDNPLSNPIGTIRVRKSNLVLFDQSNTRVWSTNITEERDRSPFVAELLADGNFVLRHSNNSDSGEFLWQSFHFPTDTLLPGMKVGWELKTGRNSFLRSWKDQNDPSIGDFWYGIDLGQTDQAIPRMFLWSSGGLKRNRASPWNGATSFGVPRNQPLTYITYSLRFNKVEETFSFQISDREYNSIMRLDTGGSVQHLIWNKTTSRWDFLWATLSDSCDTYTVCGPNSYCDMNNITMVCNCMRGFEPKDPHAWSRGRMKDGCVRKTRLSCSSEDKFSRLISIRLPDTIKTVVDEEIGFDECEQRCQRDCNCTAFAVPPKQSGISDCVIWTGELLDVRKFSPDGQDLYVRYHEKKLPKTKIIIGLSVSLGFIIILSAIIFCYWRRNKKRARAALEVATFFGSMSEENIMENLELPLMSFETISLATDNFTDFNKLGRGGFGIVYKGRLLDGQEIALKRLSKISGQGIDEFKNELMLITKVQHINLVRLLGYCINGDEKLLIYEFLENRSLDLYLFDQTQSCKLNWGTRFEIAKGIARGLLYLHQDSAVLIIHRDLKPSNVLLDKDMTPKISDFGMARIFERGENEIDTTKVVGTRGYMSPEYSQDGTYSVNSDVFSFGVIILEIISGKRNKGFAEANNGLSLLSYAWKKWTQGEWACAIDPIIDPSEEEVKRCFQVGLLCVQDRPEDRPIMSSVVVMLVSKTEMIPQPHPPGYYVDGSAYDSSALPSSSNAESSVNHASFSVMNPR